MTSWAKTRPAIGAFIAVAIAAAAPQPIPTIPIFFALWTPSKDPVAEPINTSGPYCPTDAPQPRQITLPIDENKLLFIGIFPLIICANKMASGGPNGRRSFT